MVAFQVMLRLQAAPFSDQKPEASKVGDVPELKDVSKTHQDLPLEINADHDIVYDHHNNTCVATGHVKAQYGDYVLDCDQLTTYFRPDATGKSALWRVKAQGHVVMHSLKEQQTAYGDCGVYELDRNYVTLTGENLKLTVDDLIVTARDSIEYARTENKVYAKGNAVAEKVDRLIKGNVLTAVFHCDAQGKHEIERIDAHKDVVISTKSDYATGDQGTYRKAHDVATLEGHVKISKPTEQIEGGYAEVMLNTGKSRVLNQKPTSSQTPTALKQKSSQRVQVLILPRKKAT